jgi:hypothetical protein
MGLDVDKQFFDLLTVIDNLMQKNNNLQEQNNALLQQNNSLLGAILEKPTAQVFLPEGQEINLVSKEIPSNTLVYPQFLYNVDANKFYVLNQSTHLSIRLTLPRTQEYTDIATITVAPSPNLGIRTFDLARIAQYKLVGFNLYDESQGVPTPPLTQRDFGLSCDIEMKKERSKAKTLLLHKDIIPEDDWVVPNIHNTDWDFLPLDRIIISGKNRNNNLDPDNTIWISFDWLMDTYAEISRDTYISYKRRIESQLGI